MRRAVAWLGKTQREDGTWLPLWFGNEAGIDEANPVYGTATVLKNLTCLPGAEFATCDLAAMMDKAARYLWASAMRPDGSWGGGTGAGTSSIEETAVALEALAAYDLMAGDAVPPSVLERGLAALLKLTAEGTDFPPAPIGLYFARLWYYEKLYPVIAAVAALRQMRRWLGRPPG
jgi:squalene-hopene/tetraprenyl-beta-curcumene cyclase